MHGGSGRGRLASPPDGGWGWVVVFASFMIHVIADGIAYTFGLFFVEISADLQGGRSATSGISSIMAGITYASGPLAGAFVNKWGCRPVSILGSLLAALGFGISYWATEVIHLYLSIGLLGGLGLGLIYLPAIVSVTCYFDQKRAFATGIAVCGSGVGTFILAPLMEKLIADYGWREALVISAIILLHCALFSLLFKPLPDDVSRPNSPISVFRATNKNDGPTTTHSPKPIPSIFETGDSAEPLIATPPQHPAILLLKKEEGLSISASHPVLPVVGMKDSPGKIQRRHSLRETRFFSSAQLITNRKDIFYSGSVINLDQSLPQVPVPVRRSRVCGCCPPELCAALKRMMDFSLLRNPIFLFFAISNFFTSVGYNVPYTFLADMAISGGNTKATAGFLISIIGISNTLSRVVLGYVSDKPCVNRLYLYNAALAISGIATGLVSHTASIGWLRFYAGVFGVTAGVYVSLTSVLLVDLLGLEKLTNAFGLILLFQGVATLVGPPIVGKLFDELEDYRWGFWFTGGLMALGGLMLFLVPIFQRESTKPHPPQVENENRPKTNSV